MCFRNIFKRADIYVNMENDFSVEKYVLNPEQRKRMEAVEKCKKLLEEMLLTVDIKPYLNTKNSSGTIHEPVTDYLLKMGYRHFLIKDDLMRGYFIPGSIADGALDYFSNTRKVFDGVNGKLLVEARYAPPDSGRYYIATRQEKNRKKK